MTGIELTVTPYPEKAIIAECSVCNKTIRKETWSDYADYKRKISRLKQVKTCPYCAKATMGKPAEESGITWKRTAKGDYQAIVANGDFLVFKWGNGLMPWRWRFRRTGEQTPERIRVAKTKEEAMKECEQHEEWKV